MKNIYLTMILLVSFAWASAQVAPTFHKAEDIKLQKMDQSATIAFAKSRATDKGTETSWFHAPTSFANIFAASGSWPDYYGFEVFPDTTMINDGSPMWIHSMGIVIDPVSEVFGLEEDNWNSATSMTLDSVGVGMTYTRNTASTIVDTLVIQIQVNTWAYTLSSADYSWVQSIYGTNEMIIGAILTGSLTWDASTNADANVVKTIKYPLTETDTTEVGYPAIFDIAISGVSLAGGEQAKATFTFVPGYTWTANVDSISMYNCVNFTSYGESSTGSFPFYYPGDNNNSQLMRIWAYRDATMDAMEPAYFFTTDPYPYQYHNVWFQFTALNTGINTPSAELNVSQNRPNPFKGNTTIDYSLNNSSNVNVTVYNVAGAQVMNINEGVQAAGSHNLTIDASDLKSGVYYYTFTADNKSVTKKMIVY